MITNRLPLSSEPVSPIPVLMLHRLSTVIHSGSEVLDGFAELEELTRRYESGRLAFHRRLHRGTSFGPEYLPWEQRLPELNDVEIVSIEGPSRVTRSVVDFQSFVECLERLDFGFSLCRLCLAPSTTMTILRRGKTAEHPHGPAPCFPHRIRIGAIGLELFTIPLRPIASPLADKRESSNLELNSREQ